MFLLYFNSQISIAAADLEVLDVHPIHGELASVVAAGAVLLTGVESLRAVVDSDHGLGAAVLAPLLQRGILVLSILEV